METSVKCKVLFWSGLYSLQCHCWDTLPQFFLRDRVQFYWTTPPASLDFQKPFNVATDAGHKPVFLRPHSPR